jgi:hypothetical protein
VSINLPDLPAAVEAYVRKEVTVSMSHVTPLDGSVLNTNDKFKFSVTAKNAPAPNGIALANVRYMVSVDPASGAKVQVPSGGTAIDGHGQPLNPDDNVTFFNFNPSGDDESSYLRVGQANSLAVTGQAGPNPGTIAISARIQADPDIDALFPRNYESASGDRGFPVTAT